jgi:anti-anti-sigma regulatory factor
MIPFAGIISSNNGGIMGACWTNIERNDIWCLRVDGPNLESVEIERLRNALKEATAKGARGIVIDLSQIKHLDPLGLAGLTYLPQEFSQYTRMTVAGLQPPVQELALVVYLHDVFDIYEDARAAIFDLATPANQP